MMRTATYSPRHLLAVVAMVALTKTVPATTAEAVTRLPVEEVRPLLLRAAEHGSAHGVLVGTGAAYLARRFDARTPIELDVRVLHALPQPGCFRLEVSTRQREVLVKGERSDQTLTYQLRFCRDGTLAQSAPQSAR